MGRTVIAVMNLPFDGECDRSCGEHNRSVVEASALPHLRFVVGKRDLVGRKHLLCYRIEPFANPWRDPAAVMGHKLFRSAIAHQRQAEDLGCRQEPELYIHRACHIHEAGLVGKFPLGLDRVGEYP